MKLGKGRAGGLSVLFACWGDLETGAPARILNLSTEWEEPRCSSTKPTRRARRLVNCQTVSRLIIIIILAGRREWRKEWACSRPPRKAYDEIHNAPTGAKPLPNNLGREQPIFLLRMIGMKEAPKVVGGPAPSFFRTAWKTLFLAGADRHRRLSQTLNEPDGLEPVS